MENIPQIVKAMQRILTEEADRIGKSSGFIQREVKLTGSGFLQTLVFGFQSNPELTYGEMSQSAATVGMEMSAQGIEQRFSEKAAELVLAVLEKMVAEVVIKGASCPIPMLEKFAGIYIRDSSVITLPKELKEVWKGNGGNQGANSALKIHVDLNYSTGELEGPVLCDGRSQDQSSPYQERCLSPGSLHMADLGFFDLDRFARDEERGVYWVSRWKTGAVIYVKSGERLDLLTWLRKQDQIEIDIPIFLGMTHRIPCRLLVQHVPQEVADQRRRRMKEEARKKGQPVTEERLALADWTILVTNVPTEKLSMKEAWVLLRIRWQVELLFKLWKSHAKIDEWRSQNPWRILCEVYAKLIGVVINQWIFVSSLWEFPERSLFRAAKTIQKFAVALAVSLHDEAYLTKVLTSLIKCLKSRCRQETRKGHLATFQLLLTPLEAA
jgi:hypothetical protein